MINVSKIKKGIVLDHIEAGMGYFIYGELKLNEVNGVVVLLQNVDSRKLGKKDLIKIETDIKLDFTVLGLIAPNTTVNVIVNGIRVKKVRMEVPEKVVGIMTCSNPRCITNEEKVKDIEFTLLDRGNREYKCEYCDTINKYE